MSMIGFIYLMVILGWILIVLFLKCKKTITPHFAFAENYSDAIGEGRRPSVHVIELPPDSLESEEQIMNAYHHHHHQRSSSSRRHSFRSNRSEAIDERTIETTYPTDAVINPAYSHDDEYIINAPPPSYDEVMRQPEIYPKVHSNIKSSEANI